MALAVPVSSSRVRKQKPFAVSGRWRTITWPAVRTARPFGDFAQRRGAQHAARVQLCAQVSQSRVGPS